MVTTSVAGNPYDVPTMVIAAPEAQVEATIMSFIPGDVGWLAMVMEAVIVALATTESGIGDIELTALTLLDDKHATAGDQRRRTLEVRNRSIEVHRLIFKRRQLWALQLLRRGRRYRCDLGTRRDTRTIHGYRAASRPA